MTHVPAVTLVRPTTEQNLVSTINDAYRRAEASRGNALPYALRCGELLHRAHLDLDHGDWAVWLRENFAGSHRTAQLYVQLAQAERSTPELLEDLPDQTIATAIKAIARSAPRDDGLDEIIATSRIANSEPAVYFIEAGSDGPIKIGLVNRLMSLSFRLKALQSGSPYPLKVIAVIAGDRRVEQALHRQLAEHRLCGEWFVREPALNILNPYLEAAA